MKETDAMWELMNDVTEQKPWYTWVWYWGVILFSYLALTVWWEFNQVMDKEEEDAES